MTSVVLLDVGGVLLLPDVVEMAARLAGFGARPGGHDGVVVHYAAVAAFDASGEPDVYRRRYAEMLGVATEHSRRAAESGAFSGPWPVVVQGARDALHELLVAGLRLVVVSDSDGTVEAQLAEAGLAQVGVGQGAVLDAICDSHLVGARKPDPLMFRTALAAAGVGSDQAVMVGDSVRCDVKGAAALTIPGLHVNPTGSCTAVGHTDVVDVREAAEIIVSWPRG